MSSVHEKYAKALISLCKVHDEHPVTAGIGLDGAVMQYFFDYINEKHGIPSYYLNPDYNVVQISSKTNEIDEIKFSNILEKAYENDNNAIFFDARTVTGSLGTMLKKATKDWNTKNNASVNSFYAVLFDPHYKADLRGLNVELSDEERKQMYWVKGEDAVKRLIYKENSTAYEVGRWKYNLTREVIDNFEPVPLIKKEIDLLI